MVMDADVRCFCCGGGCVWGFVLFFCHVPFGLLLNMQKYILGIYDNSNSHVLCDFSSFEYLPRWMSSINQVKNN